MNNLLKTGLIILVVSIISLGLGAKGCPFDIGPWIDKGEETIAGSSAPLPSDESPDYPPVCAGANDSRDSTVFGWANDDGYAPAGYSDNYGVCRSEFLFVNIDVPQGATIITACIWLHAKGDSAGIGTQAKFRGEAVDNAEPMATGDNFNTHTTRTNATVTYYDQIWNDNEWYNIDIPGIIQEIVDQPGWNSDNALRLFFEDDNSLTTGFYRYNASAWDDSAGAYAAQLQIEYE